VFHRTRPSTARGARLTAALAAAALAGSTLAARGTLQDGGPLVTGSLRAESGQVLAHAEVQACSRTLCLYGESDGDGRFRFELPAAPAAFVIKTPEDMSPPRRRAAALVPIPRTAASRRIDMGLVHVPQFADLRPLAAHGPTQRIDAGDGLELTIAPDDLAPAPGKSFAGVSARRLPARQLPAYDLPRGERVVAVYALHPFGATSRSPVGVSLPSPLPPGTRVAFRTIREIDGTFSDPVPGRSTGTHIHTDTGRGITELTHVVITR
jgi:hypothetical protein